MTRLSPQQFYALKAAPAKRAKYGNKKSANADSVLEGDRKRQLELMEQAGQITELEFQVDMPLTVNAELVCVYRPDAMYIENNKQIAEDAKGFKTPAYAIKAKLFMARYPHIRFAEYRRGKGRIFKKLQNGRLLDDKRQN